jgi:cytochrome c556
MVGKFKSSSRIVVAVAAAMLLVAPVVWAAGTVTRRARPPKWNKRVSDVFFADAREKLVGERPAAASSGASAASSSGSGAEAAPAGEKSGGEFAWSNLISTDTLETEIKSLQTQVSQTVQTPTQWKGGGYKDGRREFTELAVLFAIIAEYDGDVRWKANATGLRDILARAGFNCKVGTDQSYNECKLRKEDLEKLVRGESPQLERSDAKAKWDKVAGRTPLMQRIEQAQQQGVAVWTGDAGEFRKNADKLQREAELLAAMAEVIQREGFEDADDETYLSFARQMRDGAKSIAEAVKQKNYDQARKASGSIEKACSSCHESYRS